MRSLVAGLVCVLSLASAFAVAAPSRIKVLGYGRDAQGDWLGYGLARGEIVDAVRWRDAAGESAAILSVREMPGDAHETKVLFVGRYVKEESGIRVAESAYRIVEDCPEDAVMTGNILGVFDEDWDGVGELAFTMSHACISDVSPVAVELQIWEAGSVASLEGRSMVCDDLDCKEKVGGNIEAERLEAVAPRVRSLAKRLWQEHVELRSRH